jgi:hypothetical protein
MVTSVPLFSTTDQIPAMQYGMRDRLQQLRWQGIDVVDEDLGRSVAGTVMRTGFERMVADVCLGKVGAVAAREVSRFSRNSREWQQLVEVCRLALIPDRHEGYLERQQFEQIQKMIASNCLTEGRPGAPKQEAPCWLACCAAVVAAAN